MTRTLVVHIGIGKAGSTAIQTHLLRNRDQLKQAKLQYWGLNLEHAKGKKPFAWQIPGGIGILQKMRPPQAREQLKSALLEAVGTIPEGHQAIWSNESIYERPDVYGPVLAELKAESDINLTIIGYARNHYQYTLSAYKQWGIMHKTNPGRILSFHQWVNARKDFLAYGKKLSLWDRQFGEELQLFNYDSAGDIVAHLLQTLSLTDDLLPSKADRSINSSPQASELALFALYNNQFNDPTTPKGMQDILNRHPQVRLQQQLPNLASLFPSSSDISQAMGLLIEDAATVNDMLKRHGQPPLSAGDLDRVEEGFTESQATTCVMSALLSMLITQDQRIAELEKKISALQIP